MIVLINLNTIDICDSVALYPFEFAVLPQWRIGLTVARACRTISLGMMLVKD